jgi:hypothetical protein
MVGLKRRLLYFAISAAIATLSGDVLMVLATKALREQFLNALIWMAIMITAFSLLGWIMAIVMVVKVRDYSGSRWWKFLLTGSLAGPTLIFMIGFMLNITSMLFSIISNFNFSRTLSSIWGALMFNYQLYGAYMLIALGFSTVTCILYLGFIKDAERRIKSTQ